VSKRSGAQDGRCRELSGRPVCGSVRRVSLPFRKLDKIQTVEPGEIVENKRLGAALAMVKQHQDSYEPHRRLRRRTFSTRWRPFRSKSLQRRSVASDRRRP
jgi:hypothetical protein